MSAHARSLRLALLVAIGGPTLTACGDKAVEEPEEDDEGAWQTDDTSDPNAQLDPVPDGDYPDCEDPDSGDLSSGPCCVDVYCIDPPAGEACPSTDEVGPDQITGIGLGTGSCLCEPADGPYASYEGEVGECCYLVGVQSCEGRPLRVDGHDRRATLIRGRSWRRA